MHRPVIDIRRGRLSTVVWSPPSLLLVGDEMLSMVSANDDLEDSSREGVSEVSSDRQDLP